MIEMRASHEELRPRITIIGVGGAGNNAVARMVQNDVRGVDFIAVNTDAQALKSSPAERIIQIGRRATEGLGAGACPDRGRVAAEESLGEVDTLLDGTHMCFIAAGMGGGTGTGAAPVIAKAARDKGILTVGVVTKPFAFEGKRRARQAEAGLEELRKHVDTLIVIPNQNLFRVANPDTTFKQAFDLADDILHQGVRGITDLMVNPGFVNLDFADIRTIMKDMGRALMGTGEATGDNRAVLAAEAAISNPLLDEAVKGARGLVISISGGEDMRLMEVDEAAGHIKDLVDPEADIIWGSSFNPELTGRIRVSIVATGIEGEALRMAKVESLQQVARAVQPMRPMVAASMAPLAAPVMKPVPPRPIVAQPCAIVSEAPVSVAAPAPSLPSEAELLLSVERPIVLTPPSQEAIAAAAAVEAKELEALRGPSLFERMANAARGAVTRAGTGDGKAMPHIYRGRDLPTPRILARA